MDPEVAKTLIEKAWRAIDEADWDTVRALGHKDSAIRSGASQWVFGNYSISDWFEHYRENYELDLSDHTTIVMGDRAAVETRLKLTYHTTKAGFPEACGQFTVVPIASFITFRDNLFFRTHMIMSIDDWMRVFMSEPRADFVPKERGQ